MFQIFNVLMSLASQLVKGDNYQHVYIGSIELGVRNETDPDKSKPNPSNIKWHQVFTIVEQKRVGLKPITQCTVPVALWTCAMELSTLDNQAEVLDQIIAMNAGPHRIRSHAHDHCMFLEEKDEVQVQGTKDFYRKIVLNFKEANST
jgi:hypothetical protein